MYTQQDRQLQITTPLGDDAVLLADFEGSEEFNKLFHYKLTLLSTSSAVSAKEIVGKNVTFSVMLPDKSLRYFNGYVSRFAFMGSSARFSRYVAEVVPWTWFMTQTRDCRIFQDKTVPQIIREICRDFSMAVLDDSEIKASHDKWEYCVQYRETDFDFVSRLMEQEGIYSWFKHEKGKHTLMLGDVASGYKPAPESGATFRDNFSGGASSDNLLDWQRVFEFRPARWAHADYNYLTPSASMVGSAAGRAAVPLTDQFEVFDYPGDFDNRTQGDNDARLRMEEISTGTDVVHGRSINASWGPGLKFTVQQHHVNDEEGNSYVLCSTSHKANIAGEYETGDSSGDMQYSNSFTAIPAAKVYRPERVTPRPLVHGPQTAVVVGPPGETIPVDSTGRVKVSFFWDRRSQKDDTSSCWIRVSQNSAGAGWGGMFHPHAGDEVIVSFIEGDPDRPIITGRVYNGDNTTALDPLAKKTQSTLHDYGGNSIVMEGEDGNQRIKLVTPHHDTFLKIGSPNDATDGFSASTNGFMNFFSGQDFTQKVQADSHVTVYGSNNTSTIGDYTSTVWGLNVALTLGGSITVVAPLNVAVVLGVNVGIIIGPNITVNVGPQLTICKDVLVTNYLKTKLENIAGDSETKAPSISFEADESAILAAAKAAAIAAKLNPLPSAAAPATPPPAPGANLKMSATLGVAVSSEVAIELDAKTDLTAKATKNLALSAAEDATLGGKTITLNSDADFVLNAGG